MFGQWFGIRGVSEDCEVVWVKTKCEGVGQDRLVFSHLKKNKQKSVKKKKSLFFCPFSIYLPCPYLTKQRAQNAHFFCLFVKRLRVRLAGVTVRLGKRLRVRLV